MRPFPDSLIKIFALLSPSSTRHVFHLVEVEDHSCMQQCVFQRAMSNFPIRQRMHLCALDYRRACKSCLPWMHNVESLPAIRICIILWQGLPPVHYSPTSNGDNWMQVEVRTCPNHQGNYQMCLCIHTSAHMHKHTTNKNAADAFPPSQHLAFRPFPCGLCNGVATKTNWCL